ncbi:putative MATE family efflux protein [Breznakia blatticola]|uniref:Putative MATE family efflux protein n=1 Tax=Breznakia blatticola TaxID=1754012 RepID=A0A4R8A4H8_9FIRM|nr:MATE family efflux transporter [Breznakia blatticola]TDW25502.1 putative MATE family efflux protein [Breznakia blatticola]
MSLLQGNIKRTYTKYLAAAFGGAMITSIYSLVDMAMVGNYQGPEGTAALAVVAPIWNVIYSLGLLMGVGGSVMFSTMMGQKEKDTHRANTYFSVALIGSIVFALLAWAALLLYEKQILVLFGADPNLLELASAYVLPVKIVLPVFLFNQMLAAFLRNDNHPGLATAGVLAGGLFNVVGDYVFVFTLDMGIFGAGLATAIGALITFIVMLTHFWSKKNTLRIVKVDTFFTTCKEIVITGFPTFFIDIAMGILTILFNRQIMKYLDSDALAIYGPVINVSTIVQCCAYSVGQAAQPIISINYGAKKYGRIKETLKYALYTVSIFALFWTVFSMVWPNAYIYIFMKPTDSILAAAPAIIRRYSLSFILLPLNIFSTYYFQAILKPKAAFLVSVLRGCLISGALILLLPVVVNVNALWFAMPITELFVALLALYYIVRYTKDLQ